MDPMRQMGPMRHVDRCISVGKISPPHVYISLSRGVLQARLTSVRVGHHPNLTEASLAGRPPLLRERGVFFYQTDRFTDNES